MKEIDMTLFQQKAEEFTELFTLGQRIVPFLTDLFYFIKDINPLLENINDSISENLKSMPIASQQLSKVTEATETASVKIMDIVDKIINQNQMLTEKLHIIFQLYSTTKENKDYLINYLKKSQLANADIDDKKIVSLINNHETINIDSFDGIFNDSFELQNKINDDLTSIMMSLQVQDITSQQLASVNHIIETIQSRLIDIWNRFNNQELPDDIVQNKIKPRKSDENVSMLHREIAFDPHAVDSFNNNELLQNDIELLIKEQLNDEILEFTIQDELNALQDISVLVDISQEDIDEAFAGVE
ncbi:MAG: protein phosphatase CheZ [FCB group bacterium]|jgi:chemotaxis regulatin CheY-phosphate phosphatase CheZ